MSDQEMQCFNCNKKFKLTDEPIYCVKRLWQNKRGGSIKEYETQVCRDCLKLIGYEK